MSKATQQDDYSYLQSSLITHEVAQKSSDRLLTKIDIFAFLPVPKDSMVSTRASEYGSIAFIIIMLTYIGVNFYFFVTDNPATVETTTTKLDQQFYKLPRISLAFMNGTMLQDTDQYEQYWTYTFTQELKATRVKNQTIIPTIVNAKDNEQWMGSDTVRDYFLLRSPSQPMYAKGLLYSSNTCNYSKVLISMCNVSEPNNTCADIQDIISLAGKGRVFLFIEDMPNQLSISKQNSQNQNRFLLANFFLEPFRYKRVTVSFRVVKTTVYPDYFNRFKMEYGTRLEMEFVSEQSSNTSVNDEEKNQTSLEMLGISFILSPQVLNVSMNYLTIIDHIAKWGAFFNVIFTLFALFLLSYNRRKFYEKNPDWDQFRKVTKRKFRKTVQKNKLQEHQVQPLNE